MFFHNFDHSSSKLKTGYNTWWPGGASEEPLDEDGYFPEDFQWYYDPPLPLNQMNVFGDGSIHLNQYNFVVVDKDQYSNGFSNKDVYIDWPSNIANTGATIKVTGGDHTFYVNDFWEASGGQCTGYRYYFDYWQPSPGWQIFTNPLEWDFDESLTMTAYFDKQYHPGDVDGDGDRDPDDLDEFNEHLWTSRGDYTHNYLSTCDFDSDGVIYGTDNNYLLSLFHTAGYHFDEGEDTTVYDSTPYDNDGTVYGATWTTGISGSALSFDGVNDYVEVPHTDDLSGLSGVTLTAWVKLDSMPSSYSVNLGGVLAEYWLEYRDTGYLSLSTYINSNYNGDGFYADLTDNWHMLALTYNGTHKLGYLDGDLQATYAISGTLDDTSNAFLIGNSFSASQSYNGCPDGVIDEVHVHDRALSAEEIAEYYSEMLPQITVLATNQYSEPGYVPLYIDDEYVGWTGDTYPLIGWKP